MRVFRYLLCKDPAVAKYSLAVSQRCLGGPPFTCGDGISLEPDDRSSGGSSSVGAAAGNQTIAAGGGGGSAAAGGSSAKDVPTLPTPTAKGTGAARNVTAAGGSSRVGSKAAAAAAPASSAKTKGGRARQL